MAVYTPVDKNALDTFLARYDLGKLLSFSGIAEGVENTNFLLCTEKANYILTLYEKRVDPVDLPFFMELMETLANTGMNCPLPVTTREGSVLQELEGRPCAVFSFLDGTWSRFPNEAKCRELGTALATMHLKAGAVTRRRFNTLGPISWQPLFSSVKEQANDLGSGMAQQIQHRLDSIIEKWPTDLPKGLIHADLFPNNALFIDDKLTGLIDFYFACEDILAYDLAICLNSWCFEADGSFNLTKSRTMLKAYDQVRGLSNAEIKALPLLAAGSAMRFFLTRLYDWIHTPDDAFVSPKDPMEFWSILRFHQSVSDNTAYGIDL